MLIPETTSAEALWRYAGGRCLLESRGGAGHQSLADELVELITHLAFYAGWPAANTAVTIARQVFAEAGQ